MAWEGPRRPQSSSTERRAEIVRMRRRYLPLAAVIGIAVVVLPAMAAETSPMIEAINKPGGGFYGEETHAWSPSTATVSAGGVVTLSNHTAIEHGVHWVGGPETPACSSGVPVGTTSATKGANWSGTCTLTKPGTYTFYCTVHGSEMTDTITVTAAGTPAPGPTPTPTTPAPTPVAPSPENPSGTPLMGSPLVRSSQHGSSVRGSVQISKAGVGGGLEVDLLASGASLAKRGHSAQARVGRLVRSSLYAGNVSFAVPLTAKAKGALKRHRRLALTVKIVLTPLHGAPVSTTRSVVLHA
jgi:plastocyanin